MWLAGAGGRPGYADHAAQTYLNVCSNLGPATDWAAWLNGAYLLEHLSECFETHSMRRIVLTEYDLLYVPPMSMLVWKARACSFARAGAAGATWKVTWKL